MDVPYLGDRSHLRERYEALDWPQQLGNLASTLARAPSAQHDALVTDLLREAALLIEWSAPRVPSTFRLELAAMQGEVLAWWRVWPLDPARSLLALHTRNLSDRLLQMAGLVGETKSEEDVSSQAVRLPSARG